MAQSQTSIVQLQTASFQIGGVALALRPAGDITVGDAAAAVGGALFVHPSMCSRRRCVLHIRRRLSKWRSVSN
jgi:hypothetical protein